MGGATTDPAIGMAMILFGIALIAGIIAGRMRGSEPGRGIEMRFNV